MSKEAFERIAGLRDAIAISEGRADPSSYRTHATGMPMRTIGQELVQSAQEALGIAKGESQPARIVEASDLDVAAIRKRLGLSQGQFARKFGLSVATLRDWEQRRRRPDRIARTLLMVIDKHPEAVEAALAA